MSSNYILKQFEKVKLSNLFIAKFFIFITIQIIFLFTLRRFLSQQIGIQSYDDVVQHSNFVILSRTIEKSPTNKIFTIISNDVIGSIKNDTYNFLSVLPLSLINTFFHAYSRNSFIYLIYFVYIIPCFFLFYKTSVLINSPRNISLIGFVLSNFLFFFNPIIIVNLINGQSTIDGVLAILIIIYLFIKSQFGKKYSLKSLIATGIILGFLPVLHRWYSFFVLAFFATYLVIQLSSTIPRKINFISIVKALLPTILLGLIILNTFITISPDLLTKYTSSNYSKIYQAYVIPGGILPSLHEIFSKIGYLNMILFLISVFFYIRINKKYSFFILILFFTFLSFLKVQGMYVTHHFLLIFITIFLPISAYFLNFQNIKKSVFLVPFLILSFLNSFFFKIPLNQKISLLSSITPRLYYDNTKVISNLSQYLIHLPDLEKIYFISSNYYYNTTSFKYYTCIINSDYIDLCNKIIDSSDSTTRDYFPNDFPKANYILTVYPPGTEESGVEFFRSFVKKNPIHYHLLISNLFNDHLYQINIYKLTKPLNNQEIDTLNLQFYKY